MTRVSHEVSCSSVVSAGGREPDDRACQGTVNGKRGIPSPERCSSLSRIAGGTGAPGGWGGPRPLHQGKARVKHLAFSL